MTTTISRSDPSGTSSMWRTVDRVRLGYCITATWRVSVESSRTVRSTTSSRSTAPARNVRMADFSAADIGLIELRRSTKRRYPASVGTRPGEVCGAWIRPSSSRMAMSLRTVAAETPR